MNGIQKMISRTQPLALPSDFTWLSSVSSFALDFDYARYPYRIDLAQSIRNNAGPDASSPLGIQDIVSVGTSGTLASKSVVVFNNESTVQTASSSGAGTKADPYVIEDNEYDGAGTATQCILFSDTSATYYVKLKNVKAFNATSAVVESRLPTGLTLENCEFYSVNGARAIELENGDNVIDRCLISGANNAAVVLQNGGTGLTIRNLQFTAAKGNYSTDARLIQIAESNLVFDARYVDCDVSGSTNVPGILFFLFNVADAPMMQDFTCKGIKSAFRDDVFSNMGEKTNLILRNFKITDPVNEGIFIRHVDGGVIEKGEIDHTTNGAGKRLIWLQSNPSDSSERVKNVDIQNIKGTKKTGSGSANECIQSNLGTNIRIRNCWVTECTEDAFEHVAGVSGNTIEYCVADNCTGQIADFFLQTDETTWGLVDDTSSLIGSESYAHHIYGDCQDYGLIFTGLKGGTFHDIYADTTGAALGVDDVVRIENRTVDSVDYEAIDIKGSGPLTLSANRGGDGVSINTTGQGNKVRFFDNDSGTGTLTTVTG